MRKSVWLLLVVALLLSTIARVAVAGQPAASQTDTHELDAPGVISSTSTLVLTPVADAQVNNSHPDTRYGGEPTLGVHNSGSYEAWSLIRFDLSDLPDDVLILDAELRLYCLEAAGEANATLTRTPVPPKTPTRTPTRTRTRPPAPPCTGDCNDDRRVTISELVRGVNIALGIAALDECSIFDANANGHLTVDELVAATANALNGCAP